MIMEQRSLNQWNELKTLQQNKFMSDEYACSHSTLVRKCRTPVSETLVVTFLGFSISFFLLDGKGVDMALVT